MNIGELVVVFISTETDNKKNQFEDGSCWNKYFNEQFPIHSESLDKEIRTYLVQSPHEGYKIQVDITKKDKKYNAKILTQKNVTLAQLTMKDTVVNGPCKLYNGDNILIYKGNFVNGYLHGRVKKYDEEGNLIFDGFYENGNKLDNIKPCKEMKHYWEERNENGLVSYCKKNKQGNYDGICYFFQNNKISEISSYKDGHKAETIKEFQENIMIEYKNGKMIYKGDFLNNIKSNFPRNGKGVEYGNDGKTIIYEGWYRNGKRHGNGTAYKSGRYLKDTSYFCGYRRNNCIVTFALLTILIIAIIVVVIIFSVERNSSNKKACSITKDVWNYSVDANCCNDQSVSYFIPSSLSEVRTIDIGDNTFSSVHVLQIDGLNQLKSLRIGVNAFTQKRNNWGNDESKSFHILNCESLKSIEIGEYSFSDFAGQFELKNLPALQSIQIGKIGSESTNFFYSLFTIHGKYIYIVSLSE